MRAEAPAERPHPGRLPGDPRRTIASGLLAAILLGTYFATSGGDRGALPRAYVINAVVVAFAFWFPAARLERPFDLVREALPLLVWLLGWTFAWDLASAALLPGRLVFQDWWIVYPGGLAFLLALLLLHTAVLARWTRRGRGREDPPSPSPH